MEKKAKAAENKAGKAPVKAAKPTTNKAVAEKASGTDTVVSKAAVKNDEPVQKPEKVRYSDEELQEFKALILEKLAKAREDYSALQASITHSTSNDTEDTSPTFKVLEEGASSLNKEESGALAQRQYKFIKNLEAALVRIENKTYGIDRITGKLIPKERLRLVPHATMDVDSKNGQKR